MSGAHEMDVTRGASPAADAMPAELVRAMRPALAYERERAWHRLAAAGTWFTGEERLAIAAESRQAVHCALCRARKEALSPYQVDGTHDALGRLDPPLIEAVHRVSTDASRTTHRWVDTLLGQGLPATHYVEAIGVVAVITALDTFDRALGLPRRALPAPIAGAPIRSRPQGVRCDLAWVPTVAPEDLQPGDLDAFAVHGDKNIHRAMSLVPQEVLTFFDLDVELYLKDHQIRDFDHEFRALSHSQMELVAGRVSSLNGCYY